MPEFWARLDITTQDACAYHNDLAVYEGFGGVVLAAEEGQNITSKIFRGFYSIVNHVILGKNLACIFDRNAPFFCSLQMRLVRRRQ